MILKSKAKKQTIPALPQRTELFGRTDKDLSPFFQFIQATSMNPKSCLGIFTVSAGLDADQYSLSFASTTKSSYLGQVPDSNGRCLTLSKIVKGKSIVLGFASIYFNSGGAVDLNKFSIDLSGRDKDPSFVLLTATFEFCRRTHLKILIGRKVRSIQAASDHVLFLSDRCTERADFLDAKSHRQWLAFKESSDCHSEEQEGWTIPMDTSDIYGRLLGCPGRKSITFADQ